MTFDEFMKAYKEDITVEEKLRLTRRLAKLIHERQPVGFLLAECHDMSSSQFGQRCVLPYGGGATLPEPPKGPFSPTGRASDTSLTVCSITLSQWLEIEEEEEDDG